MTIQEVVQSGVAVQVIFYDGDNMCSGILHGKHIICACCGGVFEVDEVIERAREDGQVPVRVFDTWADISDEIKGDDDAVAIYATPLFCEEDC